MLLQTLNAPVDLTTLGADSQPPADRSHSIYDHVMPEDLLHEFDGMRFAMLEMTVRKLTRDLEQLTKRFSVLMENSK